MSLSENIVSHLRFVYRDITQINTDAIVDAANPSLLGGGVVDGTTHRAAKPDLLKECILLGPCPYGETKISRGYNLKASIIIHTP